MRSGRELNELRLWKQSKKVNGEPPQSQWICGHMSPGRPCVAGPGQGGKCVAAYECKPILQNGAWICDRPISNGGLCEDGPDRDGHCCHPRPACIPIRAVSGRYNSLAAWVGLATFALVVIVIGFSRDTAFLMPGPLSTAHSSVSECAGCHANVGKGTFGWLHSVIANKHPQKDSAMCVTCHRIGTDAMSPHGVSSAKLQSDKGKSQSSNQLVSQALVDRVRDYLLPVRNGGEAKIFCATCHKEHRNRKVDLSSMSDDRCQTCHAVQFTRFDRDHPEFSGYPFSRRTRIKFNHSSHIKTHFSEWRNKHPDSNDIPGKCSGCHTTKGDRRYMKVRPFGQTCSACHLSQISGKNRASGPQGVALLSLPGLDLKTIEQKNLTVGQWPSESEAELAPLMKLLLGGSENRRRLLAKVEKLDLLDLTTATNDEIKSVVRLAWEIKRLLHSLMTKKTSPFILGLRRSTGINVDRTLMTQLMAGLPRDVLISAQRDWLPNLNAEVSRLHSQGWSVSVTRKNAVAKRKVEAKQKPKETIQQEPSDRLTTNPKLGRWIVNAVGDLVQEGDKSAAAPLPDVDEDKSRKPTKENNSSSASVLSTSAAGVSTGLQTSRLAIGADRWTEFGGWYRKDYEILYKPTGHADPFMRAWISFSGQAYDAKSRNLAAPVFDLLTEKDAQGQCIKCHSVDAGAGESRRAQWRSSSAMDKKERFTKFMHEPHFQLLEGRGCMTCHEMAKARGFDRIYQSLDPSRAQSNFKSVKKKMCATCHQENAARQDCLLCHDYHVAPVETPITPTKLPRQN
jgi:hypothetical protein